MYLENLLHSLHILMMTYLFGENWNNGDIDVKTRSIITVVALMSQGITDSSLKFHLAKCKRPWSYTKRDCSDHHSRRILCRMAKSMGSL